MSMTKSQRMALATKVVEGMAAARIKITDNITNATKPYYGDNPRIELPGNGTFSFEIPELPSARLFSNHERLCAAKLIQDIEEIFAPVAVALSELFPGQKLLYLPSESKDGRHQLIFGEERANQNPVLDTALSRWKAPLVRLSGYLDGIDTGNGQVRTYHLDLRPEDRDSRNIFKALPLRVDARSVDEAFRLSAFAWSNGAIKTPQDCGNRFAVELGETLSHRNFTSDLKDDLRAVQETVKPALNRFERIEEEKRVLLRTALNKIMSQARVLIKANLVTGDVQVDVDPSAFAAPEDQNTAQKHEAELLMAARDLFGPLGDALREIHPRVYEANLTLQTSPERQTKLLTVMPRGIIDGLPWSGTLSNLSRMLGESSELACVTKEEPLRLFALVECEDAKSRKVNFNQAAQYTSATSLAHAARIFGREFTTQHCVREAHPSTMAQIMQARHVRELAREENYLA